MYFFSLFSQAVRSHNMTEAIKLLWCALGHHMQIPQQQQQEIIQPKSKKPKPSRNKSEKHLNANFMEVFNSFLRLFQLMFFNHFSMKKYEALQFSCEDSS